MQYLNWLEVAPIPEGVQAKESHHILPRKLFPQFKSFLDFPWNRRHFLPGDHLIAHYYFYRAFPHNSVAVFSFWVMVGRHGFDRLKDHPEVLPEIAAGYEKAREEVRNQISTRNKKLNQENPERKIRQTEIMKEYWSSSAGIERKIRQNKIREEKRAKRQEEVLRKRQSPEFRKMCSDRSKKAKSSPEAKERASKLAKEQWADPAFRANMSKVQEEVWETRSRERTPAHCQAISRANLGRKQSPEERKQRSESNQGKKKSKRHVARVAAALKKKWKDPEFRSRWKRDKEGKIRGIISHDLPLLVPQESEI